MKTGSRFYVITGGPGVGKTSVLTELSKCGFLTVPEDARKIIKEQIKINGDGLPWKDKECYGNLMLKTSIKTYESIQTKPQKQPIFFDRGILDAFCYFQMENIHISEVMNDLANKHPYNKKVFILPPWKEIYETDSERKQTWEEAEFTFKKMKETYEQYGYNTIEVPRISVGNRLKFILEHLKIK